MAVRVYAPEATRSGERIALSADEATHVSRVLRLGVGAALRAFDGRGGEWAAVIVESARRHVTIELGDEVRPAAEPRVHYVLAPAVLKGDGTDEVIRDAVMMGVSRVRPHVATRSETTTAALARAERPARWQRVAIASAKQCGRAVVPTVDAAIAFGALLGDADGALKVVLVEPLAAVPARTLRELAEPERVVLAVGPEGGWTSVEIDAALAAGWTPVRLGARTLRAVATPLAALAACQAVWQDE